MSDTMLKKHIKVPMNGNEVLGDLVSDSGYAFTINGKYVKKITNWKEINQSLDEDIET